MDLRSGHEGLPDIPAIRQLLGPSQQTAQPWNRGRQAANRLGPPRPDLPHLKEVTDRPQTRAQAVARTSRRPASGLYRAYNPDLFSMSYFTIAEQSPQYTKGPGTSSPRATIFVTQMRECLVRTLTESCLPAGPRRAVLAGAHYVIRHLDQFDMGPPFRCGLERRPDHSERPVLSVRAANQAQNGVARSHPPPLTQLGHRNYRPLDGRPSLGHCRRAAGYAVLPK